MTDRRLVLITWLDACSCSSSGRWVTESDLDDLTLVECQSVGWVHRQTSDYIVIYAHNADINLGGEICIPQTCIKEIRDLV